ncbi:hypothetical protein [Streptomyces sp. NPDC001500]
MNVPESLRRRFAWAGSMLVKEKNAVTRTADALAEECATLSSRSRVNAL